MAFTDLTKAQRDLAAQVQSGGIQQWQADNELNRLRGLNVQQAQSDLTKQVQSGGINQAQADAELARLNGLRPEQWGAEGAAGGTGYPIIQPGTGVHIGPGGIPIAPATNVSTPEDAISTQEQYGRYSTEQQLNANRVNEVNSYGSSSYSRDPNTGAMTRTSTLSGPQQQMLAQQQGRDLALGQVSDAQLKLFGQQGPFSYNSLPQIAGGDDLLAERRRVEEQLYSDFEKRQAPIFEQEKAQLQQSLADRGIPLTSGRAQQELQGLADRQEQTRSGIRTDATKLGQSEYSNNFNTSLAGRQQGVSEYDKSYYAPLTTMGSLQGLQGGITNPEFSAITKVDVPLTNPAAIGSTYRGQDIEKYLGELDANTRIRTAQIGADAAGGDDEGASDFMGLDISGYTGGGTQKLLGLEGKADNSINWSDPDQVRAKVASSGWGSGSLTPGDQAKAAQLNLPPPPTSSTGKNGTSNVGTSKSYFGV